MKNNASLSEFDLHLNKVTQAIKSGALHEAEKHILALINLSPNDGSIRISLADVRVAMGNLEGAIKALEDVPDQLKDSDKFKAQRKEYKEQMSRDPAAKKQAGPNLEIDPPFDPFRAESIIYPGMKVVIVDTIAQFMNYLGMKNPGQLLELDLDVVINEEDKFSRVRRDAEVLCTVAANSNNSVLELGTSFGHGTYKIATNLKAPHKVFTVNILPEQFAGDCSLVTHLIPKEEIGTFYRQHGLRNIEQFYANTLTWKIPSEVANLSMVFIDAAHDTEAVYQDTKLTWDRLAPGGFMIWHDFTPLFRGKYDWINSVMNGATKFLQNAQIDAEVVNLRNSWMGVLRKPR